MMLESRPQLAHFLLRLGLAFVLVYFGLDKALHAEAWYGSLPPFLLSVLPVSTTDFLLSQGILEVIMGVLLFFGFLVRPIGIITALLLIGVAISFGLTPMTVRDLGLLGAAFYLIFQPEAETS